MRTPAVVHSPLVRLDVAIAMWVGIGVYNSLCVRFAFIRIRFSRRMLHLGGSCNSEKWNKDNSFSRNCFFTRKIFFLYLEKKNFFFFTPLKIINADSRSDNLHPFYLLDARSRMTDIPHVVLYEALLPFRDSSSA